jgi:mannosyltransferase OCH1-like enzyme
MNIPRILHQTWKTENIPPLFEKFMTSWKNHHPLWGHILWTDEMNRAFIESNFPDFLSVYDGYDTNIQRVDAARYFILYHYGGMYVDLDFMCLQNIESLLDGNSCVLGREPSEHCKIHNKEMIISNAFIACVPQHQFIGALCKEVRTGIRNAYSRNDYILESTGPFMLTRLFEHFKETNLVTILTHDILYPLTKMEVDDLLSNKKTPPDIIEKLKHSYAIHYYWGTWWKTGKKRKQLSILGIKFRI